MTEIKDLLKHFFLCPQHLLFSLSFRFSFQDKLALVFLIFIRHARCSLHGILEALGKPLKSQKYPFDENKHPLLEML